MTKENSHVKWTADLARGWANAFGLGKSELFRWNKSELVDYANNRKCMMKCSREDCGAEDSSSPELTPNLIRCIKCKADFCLVHWEGEETRMRYRSPNYHKGEVRWLCLKCKFAHRRAHGKEYMDLTNNPNYCRCEGDPRLRISINQTCGHCNNPLLEFVPPAKVDKYGHPY